MSVSDRLIEELFDYLWSCFEPLVEAGFYVAVPTDDDPHAERHAEVSFSRDRDGVLFTWGERTVRIAIGEENGDD